MRFKGMAQDQSLSMEMASSALHTHWDPQGNPTAEWHRRSQLAEVVPEMFHSSDELWDSMMDENTHCIGDSSPGEFPLGGN